MHPQRLRWFCTGGPPPKTSLGQTFCGQPKPLTVELQHANRCATPGAEDKKVAGKWICIQFLAA
jgi:hypothetical protein